MIRRCAEAGPPELEFEVGSGFVTRIWRTGRTTGQQRDTTQETSKTTREIGDTTQERADSHPDTTPRTRRYGSGDYPRTPSCPPAKRPHPDSRRLCRASRNHPRWRQVPPRQAPKGGPHPPCRPDPEGTMGDPRTRRRPGRRRGGFSPRQDPPDQTEYSTAAAHRSSPPPILEHDTEDTDAHDSRITERRVEIVLA